jgi:hypothetical protein
MIVCGQIRTARRSGLGVSADLATNDHRTHLERGCSVQVGPPIPVAVDELEDTVKELR